MSDEDLGRLLGAAFDAQARAAVGEDATPPAPRFAAAPPSPHADDLAAVHAVPTVAPPADAPPRFDDIGAPPSRRRRRLVRIVAPLAAAAAVVGSVAVGLAVTSGDDRPDTLSGPTRTPSRPASTAFTPVVAPPAARPVTVSLVRENTRVGVGMPVVARFSQRITDARSFAAATTVTVNGRPLAAHWYFVASTTPGHPIEGHLRPQAYWPAYSQVVVTVDARKLSAGTGLRFANDLRTSFTTGAATIATVDNRTHQLSVQRDGKAVGRFRVSLGAAGTPTLGGIKVVMTKARTICLHNVNGTYYECGIQYAQQLTSSGEYLHSAPWNVRNIGVRNTSNGCTNLRPADAAALYSQLEVGDVVVFRNTSGPSMTIGDGIGDWDVPWSTWLTGGLLPTR